MMTRHPQPERSSFSEEVLVEGRRWWKVVVLVINLFDAAGCGDEADGPSSSLMFPVML